MAIPKLPDNTISDSIAKLMDSYTEETFFEYNISNTKMQSYNYIFEIPSQWARGGVESLMLSIVHDQTVRPIIFKPILEQLSEELKSDKSLFKAFYVSSTKFKDPESKTKFDFVSQKIKEYYGKLVEKAENSKSGLFLTLGISKVGKSCILNYLKNKKFLSNSKPTISTEIMELVVDSYKFNAYDVGGQEKLRVNWWNLPRLPDAIIWVIDISAASDKNTWKESKNEFEKMIQEKVGAKKHHVIDKNTPILICANKMDLNPNFDLKKIVSDYKLDKIKLNFKLQPTSSVTGEGIEEGFRWLVSQLIMKK